MTFVPLDVESQITALAPEDCPYCQVYPAIPCALHRPKPKPTVTVMKHRSVGFTTLPFVLSWLSER